MRVCVSPHEASYPKFTVTFIYPIAEHVVIQRPSRFQPDAFSGVFIRKKQAIVWSCNSEKKQLYFRH